MSLLEGLTPRARMFLRVLWTVTLLCLVAYTAYAFGLAHGSMDGFFQNIVAQAIDLGAAALCFTRGYLLRRERWAWVAMGAGLLATFAGDVTYTIWLRNSGAVPFPSLADVFYLLWYPLSYVAVVLLIRARVRGFHASMWLDGAVGALGIGAIASALVFEPILA
ncbi:MAG: diguanylate cyclase, partial [Thermoleophilaceae bacterium]|nr:diguanylate cyclase [Thermoleophilaceae bacterium]